MKKSSTIIKMSSKCITCNDVRPCFKYPDEKHALYCNNCKIKNMIDIINKVYHMWVKDTKLKLSKWKKSIILQIL